MVEILYFLDALLSFICLIIFIMIWLTGTRYWLRLLIYNKQVKAKLIDVRYSKDKKSCYGIYEYRFRGRVYNGITVHTLSTVDKVCKEYCTVFLCSLFPSKICTADYKNFSWVAPVSYIIYTVWVIIVVLKLVLS